MFIPYTTRCNLHTTAFLAYEPSTAPQQLTAHMPEFNRKSKVHKITFK